MEPSRDSRACPSDRPASSRHATTRLRNSLTRSRASRPVPRDGTRRATYSVGETPRTPHLLRRHTSGLTRYCCVPRWLSDKAGAPETLVVGRRPAANARKQIRCAGLSAADSGAPDASIRSTPPGRCRAALTAIVCPTAPTQSASGRPEQPREARGNEIRCRVRRWRLLE